MTTVEPTPDASGLRVRPYAMTGGRTRVHGDLRLESIVTVTDRGAKKAPMVFAEPRQILVMCGAPLSVAEIAAHLHLPLGVTKVLISDLLAEGSLVCHQPAKAVGDRPDLKMLERVLNGIQAL